MNLHVITPSDLRKFQLENYAEMYKNPRSFKHKIFLRKQIKQLQNDMDLLSDRSVSNQCSSNYRSNILSQRLERI